METLGPSNLKILTFQPLQKQVCESWSGIGIYHIGKYFTIRNPVFSMMSSRIGTHASHNANLPLIPSRQVSLITWSLKNTFVCCFPVWFHRKELWSRASKKATVTNQPTNQPNTSTGLSWYLNSIPEGSQDLVLKFDLKLKQTWVCKQSRHIVQTADFDNNIYDLEVGRRKRWGKKGVGGAGRHYGERDRSVGMKARSCGNIIRDLKEEQGKGITWERG